MFCARCGAECLDTAVVCIKCGSAIGQSPLAKPVNDMSDKSRVGYVLLGIFLGGLGIHNFYAGRTGTAVTQLIVWFVSFLLSFIFIGIFGFIALWIWAIVEVCTVTTDGQGKKFS